MTQYAGANAFPNSFTIPDDSAPPTASNLLVSIEALADRTVWLKNRLSDFFLVTEGLTTTTDGNPVQIGSAAVTFTSASFSGNPSALPLASVAAVAGDIFECELSGSVDGFGLFGSAEIKIIVDDGSVFDIPHASVQWAQLIQAVKLASTVDDDGTDTYVRATWNTTSYGTPYAILSVTGLLAGDVVEVRHAGQYAMSAPAVTDIGTVRLETNENGGSNGEEPGARALLAPTVTGDPTIYQSPPLAFRHTMAAAGVLNVFANAFCSASSSAVTLSTALRTDATVWRNGLRITPFAIVGRYTVTTTGTLAVGLDGELVAAPSGSHVDVVGAMSCKWRLMRSAA